MINALLWLTGYEMILGVILVTALIGYAIVASHDHCRRLDWLPGIGLIVAAASALSGDFSVLAICFYALTLILFLYAVKRRFSRSAGATPAKPRGIYIAIRAVLCASGLLILGTAVMSAGELRYNPVSDFSGRGYSDAFVQLNRRLSVEYPFGDWKQIDWQALEQKYEPIFLQAEQTGDKDLYYKTLRDYLFSMRDGHVRIANDRLYDNAVFRREAGGGFGLSALRLDNGQVRVTLVLQDSPAERHGIRPGAELLTWNGLPVQEAYGRTGWSDVPHTNQNENVNRGRFLARASVGTEVETTFRNPGETEVRRAALKAYDDQYETLKRTKGTSVKGIPLIEGKFLKQAYGYVKISSFLPDSSARPEASVSYMLSGVFLPEAQSPPVLLADQLRQFQVLGAKGLIIDLRDNPGGDAKLAAHMAGHFVSEQKRYAYASYYNRNTRKFEINENEEYVIYPSAPRYEGKVVILVNARTASAGEEFAMALQGLPHVQVVGFTGTNGSFGFLTNPVTVMMPEGYIIETPDGRNLNNDRVIQGDGDASGRGGVAPDVMIPLNETTFTSKYIEGNDVELEYAVEVLEGGKGR